MSLYATVLVIAIALAGCGGSSHTTTSASVGGAATATSTAATTSAVGTSSTSSSTSTTTTTASASAQASGSGGGKGTGTGSGAGATVGAKDPAGSGDGATRGVNGKSNATHTRPRHNSKSKVGSGAGTAGSSGSGSSGAGAAGSNGSSGNAPSSNSGIPYEVNTTSMEPSFQGETKVYYDPTRTHPQIGEVVVFYLPSNAETEACGSLMVGGRACTEPLPGTTKNKETGLKRVVGLPGDTIAIREGHVIRNGQPEPEPQTIPCEAHEKPNCNFPTPITVPPDHYYLMADNRGLYKEDSRLLGAIPQEYILGTVEGG